LRPFRPNFASSSRNDCFPIFLCLKNMGKQSLRELEAELGLKGLKLKGRA